MEFTFSELVLVQEANDLIVNYGESSVTLTNMMAADFTDADLISRDDVIDYLTEETGIFG